MGAGFALSRDADRRSAVRCLAAPSHLLGVCAEAGAIPTIGAFAAAALRAAVPTGGRRSKPSPRFFFLRDAQFAPLSGSGAAPSRLLSHPLWQRIGASPAAGGRSRVGLLTFFRFFFLLRLLRWPRPIQADGHPAEELARLPVDLVVAVQQVLQDRSVPGQPR